ncbi:MAG: tRNA preQ1(34) S-adenosylmethionine ribosyltransferase-isomerase QueA [candidate division WOR-3 bacterium]|jgi:S-adenosylmethionine:tRNA ribosyltransferase-isomerase
MKLSDFQYDLPQELIAQFPIADRTAARMLVLDRQTGKLTHSKFQCISDFLKKDDVFVLNNTRVFKARLVGHKSTGGKVEVLLIRRTDGDSWEALISHAKRMHEGTAIAFAEGITARIEEKMTGAKVRLQFNADTDRIIQEYGLVPLPHYIKREPVVSDESDYQTTFAKKHGSIAAPTAGLHFTDELLEEIRSAGTDIDELTLHIGPGTFKPIRSEHVENHQMDAEFFEISEALLSKIKNAKRVFAVGTSVCRALETHAKTRETHGWADLFIYPGYEFQLVDCLVTNFHLPGSTPLLLVCAFTDRDQIFRAYQEAIKEKYRFLSYGDGMLIV